MDVRRKYFTDPVDSDSKILCDLIEIQIINRGAVPKQNALVRRYLISDLIECRVRWVIQEH